MKPFRERNPVPIGAAGIAVIGLLMLGAFNVQSLPILGGGKVYKADFNDAGGIKKDDEVRIAGVKVGKVTGVSLDQDHVRVDLRVDPGTEFGVLSKANIKIKTLVGAHYLEIVPDGPGQMSTKTDIPVERTTAPFAVQDAFQGLSERASQIDTKQLAASFSTIADAFRDTPAVNKQALTGLSQLADTVNKRDQQLQELLQHTTQVTGVLAQRNTQFSALINDGNLILQTVQARRAQIDRLLTTTSELATTLSNVVRDNKAALAPALAHLKSVIAVLESNLGNLDRAASLLGPYARDFSNTVGSGHWFDSMIFNAAAVPGGVSTNPGGLLLGGGS